MLVAVASSNCCCGGCTFVGPLDFASGAVGDNFSTVSGSWSIGSGVLSTSSSSALLTGLTANPNGDENTKITVDITITNAGNIARVILARQDANNYAYAEIKSGGSSFLKVVLVSGGSIISETDAFPSVSEGSPFTICVSIYNGVLAAQIGSTAVSLATSFTGTGWGLGTGGTVTGAISFDNLEVAITSGSCPPCSQPITCGTCVAATEPRQFMMTITGISNDVCSECAALNGTFILTFIGELNFGAGALHFCFWRYDYNPLFCIADGGHPGNDGIESWRLKIDAAGDLTIELLTAINTTNIIFKKHVGTSFDCSTLSSTDIPWTGGSPVSGDSCQGSGSSTCTLTAIP